MGNVRGVASMLGVNNTRFVIIKMDVVNVRGVVTRKAKS